MFNLSAKSLPQIQNRARYNPVDECPNYQIHVTQLKGDQGR